jgi:hypothetical protein
MRQQKLREARVYVRRLVSFPKLAAPTREELSHILERVAVKTVAMVRHRGLLEEEHLDGLASVRAEAIQKSLSCGAPPEDGLQEAGVPSRSRREDSGTILPLSAWRATNLGPAQRAGRARATPQA